MTHFQTLCVQITMELLMTIHDFKKMKREQRKISLSTCYDFSMARILSQSQIYAILVLSKRGLGGHGLCGAVHEGGCACSEIRRSDRTRSHHSPYCSVWNSG